MGGLPSTYCSGICDECHGTCSTEIKDENICNGICNVCEGNCKGSKVMENNIVGPIILFIVTIVTFRILKLIIKGMKIITDKI